MNANAERADRGATILAFYAERFGDPLDNRANLADILADLMHMALWHCELRLDFDNQLEVARMHYAEEVQDKPL